jgi:hypothetical protein
MKTSRIWIRHSKKEIDSEKKKQTEILEMKSSRNHFLKPSITN